MANPANDENAGKTHRLLIDANAGCDASREQLFQHCCDRLERLARKMLQDFPNVQRFEQTNDVFQNAAVRLMRSLEAVKPESARHFYALAATQIRRELIDMARHYRSEVGAVGQSEDKDSKVRDGHSLEPADLTNAPDRLASWTELHEYIANLPDEERELCELLWYQGLKQTEAAELLGVPIRTLKRRWRNIRIELNDAMGDQLP